MSNLTAITVAPISGSVAGNISITAANFVSLGNTTFAPIVLTAPGNSSNGANLTLTLTGSQAVTLDGVAGSAKTGAPYELITNSDLSSQGGTIAVTTTGNLTTTKAGIGLRETSGGGNLTLISAKSLLVTGDILNNSIGNLTLESGGTTPFLVNAGAGLKTNGTIGTVSATNLTIYSDGPIETNGTKSINSNFTSLYVNPVGTLQLLGQPGDIVFSSTLTLYGNNGVTLGDAKTGNNSPLTSVGGLSFLDIEAVKGNLTAAISTYQLLNNTVGGTLKIAAVNIVRPGIPNTTPITLEAQGNGTLSFAGSVTLDLTGSQAVTVDGSAPPSAKQPVYTINIVGSTGTGQVNVQTAGSLTVNPTGIVSNAGPATLSLSGKSLAVNDSALLNTNASDVIVLSSLASTALKIQPTGVIAAGGNGIIGTVTGKNVNITDEGGITIANGATVSTGTSGSITFLTKFLENDGTVSGGASSILNVGNGKAPGLTFNSAVTVSYSGFSSLSVFEAGAINFGNLFTTLNTLSGVLNTLTIATPGSVTLGSTTPSIIVASGGSIGINAGSLLSKSTGGPIELETESGTFNAVSITTAAALTTGTAKGNIEVFSLDPTTSLLTLSSTGGALIVGSGLVPSGLSFAGGSLQGTSVIVNAPVTANSGLTVLATGSSGAITNSASNLIQAAALTIGENNPKQPAVGTNIKTTDVVLEAEHLGALSLINSFTGAQSVAGQGVVFPIGSLTYIAPSSTTATVTLGSIVTASGAINVSALAGASSIDTSSGAVLSTKGGGIMLNVGIASFKSGGNISIAANSSLSTSAGSITLLDNNVKSGGISLGTGVTMHASGTAKGVGQVTVAIGILPTTGLVVGTLPSPAPNVLTSGSGVITFTTIANPVGSITTAGSNLLNAAGRNIVFNEGSAGGTISLAGSDTIVADPPVVTTSATANCFPSPLPAIALANPTVTPGRALDFATLPLNNAVSIQSAVPALTSAARPASVPVLPPSQTSPLNELLKGKISNNMERYLNQGPMLLAPEVNTSVRTDYGSVDVAAHAVALIIAFDGGLAVYNLHDTMRDSVVVTSGSHSLAVVPGHSAVITRREVRSFEQVNPAEFVGYKRMSTRAYSDGTKTFHGQFDPCTLLHGVGPLRELIYAKNRSSEKITKSMLKTTAILMSLGDQTAFEYMVAPNMTALNACTNVNLVETAGHTSTR